MCSFIFFLLLVPFVSRSLLIVSTPRVFLPSLYATDNRYHAHLILRRLIPSGLSSNKSHDANETRPCRSSSFLASIFLVEIKIKEKKGKKYFVLHNYTHDLIPQIKSKLLPGEDRNLVYVGYCFLLVRFRNILLLNLEYILTHR